MPTDAIPEEMRKQLGGMSLLSPQVSRILDDLDDDASDSGSEEGSASDKADSTHSNESGKSSNIPQLKQDNKPIRPSTLAPKKSHIKSFSSKKKNKGDDKLLKPKPPHITRFHSLRSMLFTANIQDKMNVATEEDRENETTAASKWKEQHEKRQMPRPKTPEKDAQGRDGIGSRLKMSIRRMTSKEVPTMSQISEDEAATFEDNMSTASSGLHTDDEERPRRQRDADEQSINHSDVDELVRWVSRRDGSRERESRQSRKPRADSGRKSLGNSDVDELVRWVSRRSDIKGQPMKGLSDASTESDEEAIADSSEDEDADDLVQWVSHREGPKAGPVRRKMQKGDLDWEDEQHYDSDVPDLSRWVTRRDDTSGESGPGTPVHRTRFEEEDEPERGRSRSRSASPALDRKTHLSVNDVDELVRWVSRKESRRQDVTREEDPHVEATPAKSFEPETGDLRTLRSENAAVQDIKQKEDEKKEQLGMSVDEGSLSHGGLQEVITHVKSLNTEG